MPADIRSFFGGPPKKPAGDAAAKPKDEKKKDEPGGEAFKLEPTKRRTGGKKSYSSRLKKSCVVS